LDVDDYLPGSGLIPAPVQVFGRKTQLHEEAAGQVLRFDLAPLLAPKPDQRRFIVTHDNPGVRAADKETAVYSVDFNVWEVFWHGTLTAVVLTVNCGIDTCDNSTSQCL
jgi:hypothetical protein